MTTHNRPHRRIVTINSGAALAIGEAIGLTKRQAFYMCRKDLLPATKVGGRWTASERSLRQHLAGDEATW